MKTLAAATLSVAHAGRKAALALRGSSVYSPLQSFPGGMECGEGLGLLMASLQGSASWHWDYLQSNDSQI